METQFHVGMKVIYNGNIQAFNGHEAKITAYSGQTEFAYIRPIVNGRLRQEFAVPLNELTAKN